MTYRIELLSGAEPFFFAGSGKYKHIGCLVMHGFTGVPGDVRQLGQYLAEQGYTVLGPRLTHHGNRAQDLNRSRYHDWYLTALDGWHLLHQMACTQIVPVGLSMGGTTALWLAAQEEVQAVVSLAAPIYLYPNWKFRFSRLFSLFYPFSPKLALPPDQKIADDQFERISYNVNPVHGVAELLDYLDVVERALGRVTVPAFLAHSRRDMTVPPGNMDFIYERLNSPIKERLWLEESSHVITEGVEKDILFPAVAQFIAQHTTPQRPNFTFTLPALAPDWREKWQERWQQAVKRLGKQDED